LAVLFLFFATVKVLFKRGALIDVFDSDGSTALSTAAANGDIKTAQLLLSRGADVNACHEVTPLRAAAKYGHGNMDQLLFGKGALVNLEILSRETPLTNAVSGMVSETRMSIDKILIEHGADVHSSSRESALSQASRYSDWITVSLLINNGANPNPIVQNVTHAPIYQSIHNRNPDVSELLLERVADVNTRGLGNGYTVMHQAAIVGYGFMILRLLELEARKDTLGNDGKTPLELAKSHRREEVAELLEAAVALENNTP
jgi:ankyrin repeat protein